MCSVTEQRGAPNTALVVDDELSVRAALRPVLTDAGFQVVESGDGRHALSILDAEQGFDLLVTEAQPPGADGLVLAEAFMRKCPMGRMVLLSDHPDTEWINAESNGAWLVIPKRSLPDVFLAALRSLGLGHPKRVILVVDDDEVVRKLVRIILGKAGHAVLDASDGKEALQVFQTYRSAIDLVVSDIKMPRMTGPELADHIRRERPETHVLFMSGYASGVLREYATGPNFLLKPFPPKKLTDMVAEMLSRTGSGGATAEL